MMLNDDNHVRLEDGDGISHGLHVLKILRTAHALSTLSTWLWSTHIPILYKQWHTTHSSGRKFKSLEHVLHGQMSSDYVGVGVVGNGIHLISSVCLAQTFQIEINIFRLRFTQMRCHLSDHFHCDCTPILLFSPPALLYFFYLYCGFFAMLLLLFISSDSEYFINNARTLFHSQRLHLINHINYI